MLNDFCAYNIRGLNSKKSFAKDFLSVNKFGLFALLETHVKEDSSLNIASYISPRMNWFFNYDSHYNGRIWIGSDPTLWHIAIISSSAQIITCRATFLATNVVFIVSFVYAFNSPVERRDLWSEIKNVHLLTKNSLPWCILGDFNVYLDPIESSNPSSWSRGMLDFKELIQDIGVTDLNSSGHFFTWCDSNPHGSISRKLDRCLVNPSWLNLFGNSHAQFMEKGLSDHCPVAVSLGIPRETIYKPFQVFQHIISSPDFLDTVSTAWNCSVAGDPWFTLTTKLKKVKLALKRLNIKKGNLQAKVESARNALRQFQSTMPINPTAAHFDEEKFLSCSLQNALKEEEIFLKQKSRIHWLNTGDGNNKFFYSSCKARWNTNKILALEDDAGVLHTSHKEVSQLAVHYFSNLLGQIHEVGEFPTDLSLPCLSENQRSLIEAPFKEDDVLQTLKSMAKNRCSGPDGLSVEFFLTAWSIIGKDVAKGILFFFETLKMPRIVNATAIALIPKHVAATKLQNFRPISCCNVLYKCISKMLAKRMKSVMPDLISECQSAFVPKRLIGDNILLAQSLCRNYHLSSGDKKCAIKLDLRKAFDTLNWSFLRKALEAMRFPSMFIEWVMTCISSSMLSVKLNGALEGFFPAKSGLRQGDPISPYLFVIAMEVLTACITKTIMHQDFKYHWKASSPAITHLIFADDILLFCKGELTSVNIIMNGVYDFSNYSGMKINPEKSACFFGNVSDGVAREILNFTGFSRAIFPVTYLGLPLITTKLRGSDCVPLVQKICRKFELWTCRFLSYAGRLQLIKVVLFGIQSYWTLHLFLPVRIIKEIQSLCAKFLWGSSHTSSAAHKVSWKDCCLPKNEGGLGIRDMGEWNKASILYQFWRLIHYHNPSLWLKWIHGNFLIDKSIWTMKVPYNASWCFKKMLNLRYLVMQHVSFEIGPQSQVLFWHDPWFNHKPLLQYFDSSIVSISESSYMARIGDFILNSQWNLPSSNHVMIMELRSLLENFTFSRQDKLLWDDTIATKVNLSTIWNSIRHQGSSPLWHQAVWQSYSIPKCDFITWLAFKNRLYTKDRMIRFGLAVDHNCVLCNSHSESVQHLFENCRFSKQVLRHDLLNGRWDNYLNGNFFVANISKAKRKLSFIFLSVAIYYIWKERNNRIHTPGHALRAHHVRSCILNIVREKLISSCWFTKQVAKDPSLILLLY